MRRENQICATHSHLVLLSFLEAGLGWAAGNSNLTFTEVSAGIALLPIGAPDKRHLKMKMTIPPIKANALKTVLIV